MENWKKVILHPDMTILKAIEVIDSSSQQIGLVINSENKLLGTVTDGDIRRGILKGVSLDKSVSLIMNTNPVTIDLVHSKEQVLNIMKKKKIRQIPVVDSGKYVHGLEIIDELLQSAQYDNWVVIMAGGLGSRLGDLTKHCPKPLISVGGKPLLETILENFRENGFSNFLFSVNYKAGMIEQYFGDGSDWNVNIEYLRENKKMGTAGALSLLEEIPDKPFIVMNGDLLTKINFQQLLDYHLQHKALATMCVREYSFQVPYGVVRMNDGKLCGIEEKPVQNFFVSAGIYVIEPEALELIPQDSYFDMPSLFDAIIQKGFSANVFPIREYWVDIGKRDDLDRANNEYGKVFG
jgi:dTDP-glucose pyrophosphorylase